MYKTIKLKALYQNRLYKVIVYDIYNNVATIETESYPFKKIIQPEKIIEWTGMINTETNEIIVNCFFCSGEFHVNDTIRDFNVDGNIYIK